MKCILVYDEKMPSCHQLETLSTRHRECIGRMECSKEIHIIRLM